jgi:hypothetical protein
MPIDSPEKLSKAKELLQKAEMKLNSQLERPDYSDDLPEVQKLKSVINSARSQVNSYDSSSRQVDPTTNRLTADAGTGEEIRVGDGNALTNEYFYEPSLQSVRDRIASDPSISERLGLPKFGKREQMVGQQAVQDALQSQGIQPLPSVDTIDEQSSVYKTIADADWKERAAQAKKEGKNLARYSKIKLKDNPSEAIVGAVSQHVPAALLGAANAIAPIAPKGDERHEAWKRKALDASPTAEAIGMFAGAASPVSAGSQIGNAVVKATNYAGRSPVGKAAIGALGGAVSSVGEGELQAAGQELSQEDPSLQGYFDGIRERVTDNAIYGGALGAGGDILSQASKAGAESLRNFSPAVKGLRELENAGGDLRMPTGAVGVPVPGSAMLSPVRVPDEVMGNFRASYKDGEILSPIEIAANKVAPKIAESVDQQAQEAYRQAGESLEKYHNSPQGMSAKRVTKPARVMLDMIREGQNVGDLGTVGDAVPKIAKKLRERLMNEVERKEVSIDEYDRLKAQYGDDIIDLDPSDADNILGVSKQEQAQASVQPQVQPKTSVTQVDDLGPEVVNPFDPPAKNMSPEAMADTIPVPAAEPVIDVREAGTVPPKGKKKKADGDIKKVDRDLIPTKPGLETTKLAMNEYGQKMYPYRDAMRGSNMRTEKLMEEFPYVENAGPISTQPSELEAAITELPERPPLPKSDVEDISSSDIEEISSLSPNEKKIAEDSFNRSYEEGVAVPNEGNYTPEYVLDEVKKNGGVDGAARLNKGMRDMTKPMSAYKDAKTPQEATKIATSLEHPIELAIDNGTTVLRDGRHRLEAAKRAGATEIKARVRVFRPDGKAEEAAIINLPIGKSQSKSGSKTVLVPRARNSRQIEKIQQDIAEDLQGISKDSDWLKKVDKAFRETRDQFEPNEFTPGEMTLDDGTKVTGLSALQRKHHELLKEIDEMKLDTSSKSKTAILNKIKAFASGQNGTADKELLEQAKKLGLEKELRQVAATRVVPGLKTAGSPLENEKGIFTGLKNAGIQRVLPVLEAVGNVPGNPFIANPNTPAGRIQKYLFENSAKNLLNFEGGRLGRFGNEVNDLRDKNK